MSDSPSRHVAPAPRIERAVLLIVAIQLGFTLALSAVLNVWLDEAITLDTTSGGVTRAFHRAVYFELHPPGHFVTLAAWRSLGDGLWFARLLSALFVAGTLLVLARLWRRFETDIPAAWFVLPMAMHPFTIYAATEARPAAMTLFLATAFWWSFCVGFRDPGRHRGARIACAAFAWGALVTQYYAGFLLVAAAVPLLVERRWRALRDYVGCMLLVGVAFLPLVLVVADQLGGHLHASPDLGGPLGAVRYAYGRAATFLLPTHYVPDETLVRRIRDAVLVTGLMYLCFFSGASPLARGRLRRHGREPGRRTAPWRELRAVVITAAMTLPGYLVAGYFLGTWVMVQTRHMASWFPVLMLSACGAFALLGGPRAARGWAIVMVIFSAVTLVEIQHPLAKRGDWIRVAAHLETEAQADEPIFVFHSPSMLPLDWHYDGSNELVPVPRPLPPERWHLPHFSIESAEELEALYGHRFAAHDRAWLVTDGIDSYMGVAFNRPALEQWVAQNFEVLETQRFFHAKVRLIERRSEPLDPVTDEKTPTQDGDSRFHAW